ncbi:MULTISPECIES: hypothetical protein [Bacteroides]|uniref:hypothetical protein n=1 Tax=Bacteroides TaxID=816 RepID=UPI000B26AA84|nr:hypothetical protein [Bacteroides fragilis]MCM0365863.1 hypothetical protein [Bacteroides fragilis]MDA1487793.1 hypothetical protein [Bacteroides fragilis]
MATHLRWALTYYKEKDLHEFIRRYFDNSEEVDNKKEDSYEISPEVGEQKDTNNVHAI